MLTIQPNEGVGTIRFGMLRRDVHALLGVPDRQKKRDSPVPADFYNEHGLIVEYDPEEVVEAVEIKPPADPSFMSRALIGVPFEDLAEWFRSIDPRIQFDGAGLTSFRFGIGLYAPHAAKLPGEPVEGVIAFRPGYYD